jgi:uncharacterized GH25 family protein
MTIQTKGNPMKLRFRLLAGLAALASLAAPLGAQAHRAWFLPSFTVLSGDDPWVGIDGAISNELFYPDHRPMQAASIKVLDPDGAEVAVQGANVGKFRTTFDLQLTKVGTYKVFTQSGTSRNETFITRGSPSTGALKPTGVGLELQPVTHPNDLIAGEAAKFIFLRDGKPAAGLEVTILPGESRYRDNPGEIKVTTAADGSFSVKWPEPGYYWMNATIPLPADEAAPAVQVQAAPAGTAPAGPPRRRGDSYTATFEVMQP